MKHSFVLTVDFEKDIGAREAAKRVRLAAKNISTWTGDKGKRTENRVRKATVVSIGEA